MLGVVYAAFNLLFTGTMFLIPGAEYLYIDVTYPTLNAGEVRYVEYKPMLNVWNEYADCRYKGLWLAASEEVLAAPAVVSADKATQDLVILYKQVCPNQEAKRIFAARWRNYHGPDAPKLKPTFVTYENRDQVPDYDRVKQYTTLLQYLAQQDSGVAQFLRQTPLP